MLRLESSRRYPLFTLQETYLWRTIHFTFFLLSSILETDFLGKNLFKSHLEEKLFNVSMAATFYTKQSFSIRIYK